MISDDNIFCEVKKAYAKDMVTGFIKLNGMTVGAVANRSKVYNEEAEVEAEFDGSLSADGAEKAAEFVQFCDAFNIPVLTLTNVSGFTASKYDEKRIAKSAAKLTYAFADATVPKVNVVIGKAFGSAYVTMNSKAVGADMVYAWPDAEIGMMDANQAAKIMYADADAATIREKAAEYKNLQSSPLSAAKRGYVDTIIEAADTRKYVIGAFEMLFTKERIVRQRNTVRFREVRQSEEKISVLLCVLVAMLCFTACGSKKENLQYDKSTITQATDFLIEYCNSADADTIEQWNKMTDFQIESQLNQAGVPFTKIVSLQLWMHGSREQKSVGNM